MTEEEKIEYAMKTSMEISDDQEETVKDEKIDLDLLLKNAIKHELWGYLKLHKFGGGGSPLK